MKNYIIFLFIILFGSLSVFGQTKNVKKTNSPKTQVKTKILEREKLDPLRNPAEDLQAAIETAKKENKRIILDIGGEWCIWCRWLDEYFIKNSELTKFRDENFIWLKVNMSSENENSEFLSAYPQPAGYPHLYVLETDGKLLHSQGTAELEEKKSYNMQKLLDFLKTWSPQTPDGLPVIDNRRPKITLYEALTIANEYIEQNNLTVSDKYIDSVKFYADTRDKNRSFWTITWQLNKFAKGGQVFMEIYMDKSVKVSYGE